MKEELGIDVSFERLIPLGVRQTAATIAPDYSIKEFQYIFQLVENHPLKDYPLSSSEVAGLVEVSIGARFISVIWLRCPSVAGCWFYP
ncbi:hypothetical protein [Shimazuella alba]|uniref:Nudix hydrolase domain-containing protein n=1 Tax=Shimazuella alba TaxID=2690964 RepID=A0A6I4VU66_9BACL|nr:hypothetical protein [Shimazuella alba]MXQ55339.1 hypothetical protein [Shimazuella alba]